MNVYMNRIVYAVEYYRHSTAYPPCWLCHVTYSTCPHFIVVKLVYSHIGCDFYS